jgi:hypothetical protein
MAISIQPVSVCVTSSPSFHFYKSGILDDIECGEYIDHCIVAVGKLNKIILRLWN